MDWQLPVAGGTWWRVLLLRAQLVTSAVVANRLPVLAITDGEVPLYELPAPAVQAASLTTRYSWAIAGPDRSALAPAGPIVTQALPDVILPVGGRLTIATTAIDAGDTWTLIRAYVQQIEAWPSGPPLGRLDAYSHTEYEGASPHAETFSH